MYSIVQMASTKKLHIKHAHIANQAIYTAEVRASFLQK